LLSKGEIIKTIRERKKISLDDLSRDICSSGNLSKIENGIQEPTWERFCTLLERMGEEPRKYTFVMSKGEEKASVLYYEIGDLLNQERYQVVKEKLEELSNIKNLDRTWLRRIEYINIRIEIVESGNLREGIEKIENLINEINETFDIENISRNFFTRNELNILNYLASLYTSSGEVKKGVRLYKALKEYVEHKVADKNGFTNFYGMVIYNYSKYVGLSGDYENCIDLCDIGIKHNKKYGGWPGNLAGLFLNKGLSMLESEEYEQHEAIEVLLSSYLLHKQLRDIKTTKVIEEYIKNKGLQLAWTIEK